MYEFRPDDAFRFAREQGQACRQAGNELRLKRCPYCGGGKHDEYTFAISLIDGGFNCKRASCGRKGGMIALHRDFGFSLGRDVDAYLDGNTGRFKAFRRPKGGISTAPAAVKYLQSRGISQAVTERYEITVKKSDDGILTFPFFDENGLLWFVKYRRIDGKEGGSKEWCEADRKPILFGMNHCNFENPRLVMTEGQIDSLSCTEAGIENAVSVPLGKNGFTWVPHCWNFLQRFKELVVFGDNENGEITLLKEMQTRFGGSIKCVRAEDYKGCKDANDILRQYGPEAIRAAIENAEPLPVKHLRCLRDIERVKLSELGCIKTGLARLDGLINGFYFGQLIGLTGPRGDGKSTLGSQFATFAMKQGCPVYIYSGEMNGWTVRTWLDMQLAGPLYTVRNGMNYDITIDTYRDIEAWPQYGKCWIYDDSITIGGNEEDESKVERDQVLTTLEESIRQYGVKFAVIDNLMTAMDISDASDLNQAQTIFVKRLVRMAKQYNIVIVLIVHPKKMDGRRTLTNDDIAGSSNITNLCDTVITYFRPQVKDGEAVVDEGARHMTVLKDRFAGHTDHNGFPLFYDTASKRISCSHVFDWQIGWEPNNIEQPFMTAEEEDDNPFL